MHQWNTNGRVTAIKPLKNKLFSVTSNPSTLVYFMSSMIQFHSWLNLLTAARLNQTWFKKYFPVSLSTIYNIKREDIMLEILYSSTNQKIRHLQEIELVPTILQSFSFTLYKSYTCPLIQTFCASPDIVQSIYEI